MSFAEIRTASEALQRVNEWGQIDNYPNNMGHKAIALLEWLNRWQDEHKTAKFVDIPTSLNIVIPTAAIGEIQSVFGYVITATPTTKPAGYTGNINNWSKVTKIDWTNG